MQKRSKHLAASLLAVALLATLAVDAAQRRVAEEAPPPKWDRRVLDLFFPDARERLGPRDAAPPRQVARSESMPAAPSAPATGPPSDRFAWSALVSREVLEDEVKNAVPLLLDEMRTATRFKSGGYQVARREYSMLAVVFGVIALYDGDVRWQTEAAGMRDLLARAGFNCKVASDSAYNEAKLRSDDLAQLVRGGTVDVPEGEPSTEWPEFADRRPLMSRLEVAQRGRLDAWTASESEFSQHRDEVLHEAQILALLSQLIEHEDYEFGDDATYREYTAELREHALGIVEAARQGDAEMAREALGGVTKSCDNCHGDFRS